MSDKEMDFVQHLDELRSRLIYSIIGVAVGMAVAWRFAPAIQELMLAPIQGAMPDSSRVIYQTFLEPFMIQIQIALVAGLILAAPFVLWQGWAFVAPGLLPHERRYVSYSFPASVALFAAGVVTAYFAFPFAVRFLLQFMAVETDLYQSLKLYLAFFLRMLVGFGLVYQAPLILMFLAVLEIVSLTFLLERWRHAVFACFLIAAIVTPTWDPFNMSLLAAPLMILYGLSLILVWWVEFFRRRRREREEPQLRAVVDAAVEEAARLPAPPEEETNPVEAHPGQADLPTPHEDGDPS